MQNYKPVISVIIPTYNGSKTIKMAIESVLNQSFQDFELIVVDDGSTDSTQEVVISFQKTDSRIRYIKLEKNSGGPAYPLNVGIKLSQSEFIAILEHDDRWLPKKLEQQLNLFQNNQSLAFVGCNIQIVYNDSGLREKFIFQKPLFFDKRRSYWLEKMIKRQFFFNLSALMFKKEILTNYLFDERLKIAVDQDICLRLIQQYEFDFVDEVLVEYHIHRQNLSRSKKNIDYLINDWRIMISKYKDIYRRYKKEYFFLLLYIMHLFFKKIVLYFITKLNRFYTRTRFIYA